MIFHSNIVISAIKWNFQSLCQILLLKHTLDTATNNNNRLSIGHFLVCHDI